MSLGFESVKLDQLLSALASRPSYSANVVDFIEGNREVGSSIESTGNTEGMVDVAELKMRGCRLDLAEGG